MLDAGLSSCAYRLADMDAGAEKVRCLTHIFCWRKDVDSKFTLKMRISRPCHSGKRGEILDVLEHLECPYDMRILWPCQWGMCAEKHAFAGKRSHKQTSRQTNSQTNKQTNERTKNTNASARLTLLVGPNPLRNITQPNEVCEWCFKSCICWARGAGPTGNLNSGVDLRRLWCSKLGR